MIQLTRLVNGKREIEFHSNFMPAVSLIVTDVEEKYSASLTLNQMIAKSLHRIFYKFFEELHIKIDESSKKGSLGILQVVLSQTATKTQYRGDLIGFKIHIRNDNTKYFIDNELITKGWVNWSVLQNVCDELDTYSTDDALVKGRMVLASLPVFLEKILEDIRKVYAHVESEEERI